MEGCNCRLRSEIVLAAASQPFFMSLARVRIRMQHGEDEAVKGASILEHVTA
jgi:hypothetical protein